MSELEHAKRRSILFICMGNICRSPLAEGVFLHLARKRGIADRFEVDSAGTGGWHAGEPPDPRATAVAEKHGVVLVSRARRVDPARDFSRFEYLIAMDRLNLRELKRLGAPEKQLHLLRRFDPATAGLPDTALEVPDPYYGGPDGFDAVFEMVRAACNGLLDKLSGRDGS